MTTLLFVLGMSLGLSLSLTVAARNLGIRFGAVDRPDERKVHDHPIPRTGGLAIFASFFLALAAISFFDTPVTSLLAMDRKFFFVVAGAVICFAMGVVDDLIGLRAWVKLVIQIVGASAAYAGGVHIANIVLGEWSISFGIFSYFITILWFLLFMNAVNLVDGLDGLAGGIVVFASLVMIVLSVLKEDFFTAVVFTALAGSVLGFLRYNFNPASVFMGDGGSYFLGYVIAAMGILGSVKSQVAPAMMIPVLALGVPIFDTLISPVRRFMRGRAIFSPDKSHIHHRLRSLGLSTPRAVLLLYGVTVGLCLIALLVANLRDERAGLFLVLLGVGAVFFIRKLGYFEYLGTDKFLGWLRDMTDESGLGHQRRGFLNLQIEVARSEGIEELWKNLIMAGEYLRLDYMELRLLREGGAEAEEANRRTYVNTGFDPGQFDCTRVLHVVLPLSTQEQKYGCLTVSKDLEKGRVGPFMLRRIEQLRRSTIEALKKGF